MLLICPACDEPCAEIPPCTKECLPGTPPDDLAQFPRSAVACAMTWPTLCHRGIACT